MSEGLRKLEWACARVSKDEDGSTPSCFETAASPPPQHEGEAGVCGTNLRLWETSAGSFPLFWDCYLQ